MRELLRHYILTTSTLKRLDEVRFMDLQQLAFALISTGVGAAKSEGAGIIRLAIFFFMSTVLFEFENQLLHMTVFRA